MSKHSYQPINEHIATEIVAIHNRYPKLGHHGILSALEDDGIRVDPQELERFMAQHSVTAEKPFKPLKFKGAPRWMTGNPWEED